MVIKIISKQKTIKCKKCGKTLPASQDTEYKYCMKYLEQIDTAIDEGAITLRRLDDGKHFLGWAIYQSEDIAKFKDKDMYTSQVPVIVQGRELAKKYNVPVIFNYQKHSSLWFLDDYLDTHPNIKFAVEKLERKKRNSIIGKIATAFGKKKVEESVQ